MGINNFGKFAKLLTWVLIIVGFSLFFNNCDHFRRVSHVFIEFIAINNAANIKLATQRLDQGLEAADPAV